MQQNFDTIGRLCAVGYSGSTCSSGTTFATGFAYNAAGQVTGFNYGNGVAAAFGYTPDRLLLQSLAYTKGSTTLFSTNYWYKTDSTNCPSGASGNNGQIQCITDNVDSGRTASYSYDALYRLTAATTNGSTNYLKWGLSMSYDRYGNRLSQSQTYGAPPANSVTVSATTNQITGSPYAYDANGNMTNDGNNTLVYDAENRLLSATNGGSSGTYTYDGNSLRVKKVSGATTTVYIFSGSKVIAEYDNGAAVGSPSREYIYSGGTLLAKIDSSGTKYYHQDHLSNRVVTDSSGNTLEQLGHYPFGESWYDATSDKLLFTTYERDAESGNDYATARSFVNRLGRFSSPDPLPGSLGDPQSLNKYAYSLNDPANLADPTGLSSGPRAEVAYVDYASFAFWQLEVYSLGADFNSDLSITSGDTWNGEEWVQNDNPGVIFDDIFPPGVPGAPTGPLGFGPLPMPPPPLPLECTPAFIAAANAAWTATGSGMEHNAEAGFEILGSTDHPFYTGTVIEPPRGALTLAVTPNTIYTFHTHPNNLTATPTIPGADQGRFRQGDHAYVPFYVGSRDGLFVSDPGAKTGYDLVRSGLDWLHPCR